MLVEFHRLSQHKHPQNLKQFVYALFTQKSEESSYPTQTLYSEAINPNCFL